MTVGSNRPKPQETPLPMAQQRAQHDRTERREQDALNAVIREQVIHALGEPGDLLTVAVRPLWNKFYRVNIFVGAEIAFARVANSYFLEVDADGKIATATPKITRQYGEPRQPAAGV